MNTSEMQVQASSPQTQHKSALHAGFRPLFEAEFDYVCRSLRRLGVYEADLKDVSQELFVTINANLSDYDPARAIRPWLFSYAVRYASNYRRLSRNKPHDSDSHLKAMDAAPKHEARNLVLRALEALSFDRRTMIVMHDLEGFDAPEIAAELNIPLNTVYSRIRLAREDFRAAVTNLSADPQLMPASRRQS
jgi:RNA polymerase sigma-70 factor, ECF subfamily